MSKTLFKPLAVLSAAALLLAASSALAAPAPSSERAAVEAVTERWAKAFANGDLNAITGLYTADAKLLPDGGAVVAGKADIARYFETTLRPMLPGSIHFSRYEVYGDGQSASSLSLMEIRDAKGAVTLKGKQALVLLKQGGAWKIHRDIWNGDGPATGAH